MRMTSKGQVTIPKDIREKLGVGPGDEIGFREDGQTMILERMEAGKRVNAGEMLAKHLLGKGPSLRKGQTEMTSEEIVEMFRGRQMNTDDTAR